MDKKILWTRILYIISLAAMLVGFLDPLEGAFIILPASALLAVGAYLGQSRYRILVYWAFGLILVGVAVMIYMSSIGGLGGDTGRSMWWAMTVLPYPVGAIMAFVIGIMMLVESVRKPAAS